MLQGMDARARLAGSVPVFAAYRLCDLGQKLLNSLLPRLCICK